MHILLLPLDERPANTRFPAQVAAIAGARLALPPPAALPDMRVRADQSALTAWLREAVERCDGVVASVDLLGYGGLIASRTTDDDVVDVLQALAPLTELRRPNRPVFAFNVVQRISNANDATEEPAYWADYGTRLYRWSREFDASGQAETLPADILRDWLTRRARNHAVNLGMLREAALGKFDLLVIPSDDTSPIGLSARERKHLEAWRDLLFPPSPSAAAPTVLMYPGADDLGSALVARMINHKRGHTPGVFAHYADDAMRGNTAPYEDRPISQAVASQIMAVGARRVEALDDADVILAVSPPFERSGDGRGRDPHWADLDPDARRAALAPFVDQVARWVNDGRRVAVADVAFPNGAEPALVELLFERADVARLAAYGGWNTAGNTLGTVLGSACVPQGDDGARRVALAHRLLEDWGYQSIVRNDLISWLSERFGAPRVPPAHLDEAAAFTAAWLQPLAERIARAGLPCAVSDVRLPWRRTFEVDFDL